MGKASLDELFGQENKEAPEALLGGLNQVCEQFLKVRESHDKLNAELKAIKDEMGKLEQSILDKMSECDVKTIKINAGYSFTRVEASQFSLPPKSDPERRHQALVYLARIGAKELIQPDIPAPTLKAFLRERQASDKPINTELITEFVKINLSVRKEARG